MHNNKNSFSILYVLGNEKIWCKVEVVEVNKKARRDYEILESLEVGISLLGSELKSSRKGGLSLRESYVQVKGNECYLTNAHIAPYEFSRGENIDPYRERKLLLHKREIIKFAAKMQAKGLTLIPLRAYLNDKGRMKLEIGLGKGKKLYDKRADIKEKTVQKKLDRVLKTNR